MISDFGGHETLSKSDFWFFLANLLSMFVEPADTIENNWNSKEKFDSFNQ
jgi:hypothetical protein